MPGADCIGARHRGRTARVDLFFMNDQCGVFRADVPRVFEKPGAEGFEQRFFAHPATSERILALLAAQPFHGLRFVPVQHQRAQPIDVARFEAVFDITADGVRTRQRDKRIRLRVRHIEMDSIRAFNVRFASLRPGDRQRIGLHVHQLAKQAANQRVDRGGAHGSRLNGPRERHQQGKRSAAAQCEFRRREWSKNRSHLNMRWPMLAVRRHLITMEDMHRACALQRLAFCLHLPNTVLQLLRRTTFFHQL